MPVTINPKLSGVQTSSPIILAQDAIPVILAPNGTVATNGTITLGTALPTIYANAWVRLPAGAVVGGLAGLYFATFSSATVGVITTTFVDAATAFTPYIPASTTVAVGSNAAYTQTTAADITLCNVTVPGGLMGANGGLRHSEYFSQPNNANTKTPKLFLGATSILSVPLTASASIRASNTIRNRGTQSSQMYGNIGTTLAYVDGTSTSGAVVQSAINTAIDQALTFTGQLAVATDYIVLEGFTVEVLPA